MISLANENTVLSDVEILFLLWKSIATWEVLEISVRINDINMPISSCMNYKRIMHIVCPPQAKKVVYKGARSRK